MSELLKRKEFPDTMNGDNIVQYTNSKMVASFSDTDLPSLEDWYHEDPAARHLGLLQPISRAEQISTPLLTNVLSNGGRIEVNGYHGSFTYDLPVSKDHGIYTIADTSGETSKPGIDGGVFKVGLNREFASGTVLSYDAYRGEQFVVASERPVYREGDVWFHFVKHVSDNKRSWFPNEFLKAGIEYFPINHGFGEFSTQLAKINYAGQIDMLTCEFVLGNVRGVEGSATMFAGDKYVTMAGKDTKTFLDMVQKKVDRMGKASNGGAYDTVIIGRKNPATGNLIKGSTKVMSIIEYLALAELFKLENISLMFQKPGVISDNNSVVRFNEGYYHQLRRGYRLEYSRPGKLPMARLRQAAEYMFRSRRDIPMEERRIKFKAGRMAYENVIKMLTNEFNLQIQWLMPLLGRDRILPSNPVSGSLDALSLDVVRVAQVFIPGIGHVSVEHDPSLDWMPYADISQQGFYGSGYPKTSYSLLIEDITASEYSNAFEGVPGNRQVSIKNPNANTFYVTPMQGSLSWGFENGRYDFRSNTNIMSSSPKFAQTFFCYSSSALWVKDLSRHVLIELA